MGYYVFFRCWPGFSKEFPFEIFDKISDADIDEQIDDYAREWFREHGDEAVRVWQKKCDLRGAENSKQIKAPTRTMRPNPYVFPPRATSAVGIDQDPPPQLYTPEELAEFQRQEELEREQEYERKVSQAPYVFQIAKYAGWAARNCDLTQLSGPIIRKRHAVAGVVDEQVGQELVRVLNEGFLEGELAEAQPWFWLQDESSLTSGERASYDQQLEEIIAGTYQGDQAEWVLPIGQKAFERMVYTMKVLGRDSQDHTDIVSSPQKNQDYETSQTTSERNEQTRTIKLDKWGVALVYADTPTWSLFHLSDYVWRRSCGLHIPPQIQVQLAQLFIENGGCVTRKQAVDLFRPNYHGIRDGELMRSTVTPNLRKLRRTIKNAIKKVSKCENVANPIPWDSAYKCWRAQVIFSYATQNPETRRWEFEPKNLDIGQL